MGCHGGAGVSTLAHLVPGGMDAQRAWPNPQLGGPGGVILVCRSNASGCAAASAALRQWGSGGTPLVTILGLVVMADAPGRLPRSLADQLKRISGLVPRMWTVPWVPAWRLAPPEPATAPAAIRRLGQELQSPPWVTAKGH
ncbi:hypothetical protein GCM10012275_60760 [Longimycelium tulufanense]|uniref:Uncharacterized protein n=1 Tax=Longimycelium tulufanense TaxID=907463 RepID=A0A8J3CIP5_9PSEU|nr:hypothetical protein GCM10012275_60760 [Longimycelium tulufanense]